MGCIKLDILDKQYKRTELRVSYREKELTSNFFTVNGRRDTLVNFIDPDGRDAYHFDENGNFVKKYKEKGEHYGVIEAKAGGTATTFKFADPKNDPKSIDDGKITRAVIVPNESINEALTNSGVFDKSNQNNKRDYILNESNASSLNGTGKMDYVVTADFSINGEKQKGLYDNTLYVTKTESGYTGHNNYNFGNFLWGAGASALGFWKITARAGAHLNNWLNDPANVGIPWYQSYKRSWDSKDDQRSISIGVDWMKQNRKK